MEDRVNLLMESAHRKRTCGVFPFVYPSQPADLRQRLDDALRADDT